nr:uncharacterized protein LOC123775072 [Procambarus clarkii]
MTSYMVAVHSQWAETNLSTPFRHWSHFCFTYLLQTAEWHIYMNGQLEGQGHLPIASGPLLGGGVYVLGQEQDKLGGGFDRDQTFSGEITALNVWFTVLNASTIRKLAGCESEEEGDALGWSRTVWNISGEAQWQVKEMHQVCHQTTGRINFFADRFTLDDSKHFCKVVGGRVAVPVSEDENSWLYRTSQDDGNYCSSGLGSSYLWMGASDQVIEGTWQYLGTNLSVPWQGPWRGGKPNGGLVENCLVMLAAPFAGQWSDIACVDSYQFCVACEFTHPSMLYLKGPALCTASPFNQEYVIGSRQGSRTSLEGYFDSDIFWDLENSTWIIKSLKIPGAVARWKPEGKDLYPLGTKTWVMGGKVCDLQVGEEVNLTLSVCGGGEFTCSDGTCINLTQRCDLRINCPDQSDEASCSAVSLPDTYRNTIPPPPTKEGQPLDIYFFIDIISFLSIATEDLTFTTTMSLHLRWQDVRLTYHNLHDEHTLNLLSKDAVEKIWTPTVSFSNAHGNVFTNLERGSRVECVRQKPSRPSPPQYTHETNIFSGLENSMEMSQSYTAQYSCDFDLIMFPFDAQVCSLQFTLVSAASSYMVLKPSSANYSGPKNLIEYTIGRVTIQRTQEVQFSSVKVEVRFFRRYNFYLLTLYIPTALLIVIAYASFFFNPDDFNSRITVALTALLVLASLFTQMSNSLPKTSYFKLVDVWLFFAIVIIFVVVILQTLIDFFADKDIFSCFSPKSSTLIQVLEKKPKRNQNDERKSRDLSMGSSFPKVSGGGFPQVPGGGFPRVPGLANLAMLKFSRILIPIVFVLFNIIYWASAFNYVMNLNM